MKKMILYLAVLSGLMIPAFAGDDLSPQVRAYPVPYDPDRGQLCIDFEKNPVTGSARIEIFDAAGDRVLERESGSLPFYWRGYNAAGRKVANGLYLVVVHIEDLTTGEQYTRRLRILVRR